MNIARPPRAAPAMAPIGTVLWPGEAVLDVELEVAWDDVTLEEVGASGSVQATPEGCAWYAEPLQQRCLMISGGVASSDV